MFLVPPSLCTDNAAMAWAGIEQSDLRDPDDLWLGARPRMPLDDKSRAMLEAAKGAKA